MPIYEKSTRHLLKDYVKENGLGREHIVTRDQIVSWFKTKYPKLKKATVDAHLIKMSVNAPSRFHYNANPNGEDDLFFQIDGSRFRLYTKDSDPPPIYAKVQTHVLQLCNDEFKPLRTGLREAFAVDHEVQQANVEEGVEDILSRLEQSHGLLA